MSDREPMRQVKITGRSRSIVSALEARRSSSMCRVPVDVARLALVGLADVDDGRAVLAQRLLGVLGVTSMLSSARGWAMAVRLA